MYPDLPPESLGSTDVAGGSIGSADSPAPPADAPASETPAETPVVGLPMPLASFKTDMARAMQVVAEQEHARIDASVGDDETAQVEKVHVRAAAEAVQLKKHADEDVSQVNARFDEQVKRLREAADRQIDDRHKGLEEALTHHGSLIASEVQSVHTAVEGYRASLDAFFGRLAEEQDPSVIARMVGTLPDLPDLDAVRADARSRALRSMEDGSSGVAVTVAGVDQAASQTPDDGQLQREPVAVMDPPGLRQRVSILSGMGMSVGRPGPWFANKPAANGAEPTAAETVPATEAGPEAAGAGVPATPAGSSSPASTIWNSTPGERQEP